MDGQIKIQAVKKIMRLSDVTSSRYVMFVCLFVVVTDQRTSGFVSAQPRNESQTEFHTIGPKKEVEYFFASDAR